MSKIIFQWLDWLKLCDDLEFSQNKFVVVFGEINFPLREKKGTLGKWSAKDLLAHITGWELEVIKMFNLFLTDQDVDDEYDINSFNEESVLIREKFSWEEIMKELKSAQVNLNKFLSSLSEKNLNFEPRFSEWVSILINHYNHHTDQVKALKECD